VRIKVKNQFIEDAFQKSLSQFSLSKALRLLQLLVIIGFSDDPAALKPGFFASAPSARNMRW
jgi:hypothetical protein